MYGLTKENHLLEIEACYQGTDLMYNEVKFAMREWSQDGWDNEMQALLELGIVILQVPQVLHTCESMGDDIRAIEEWASIFKDPARLSAVLAKNMALHKKAIQNDIALDKREWHADEWFRSGETTADLATLAIGPVKPHYGVTNDGFDVMAVPDFIAGMIYGFTGDNQMEEIEACFHGTQDLVTDAENLVTDLTHGDWVKAIHDNADFADQLEMSLSQCTGMDDDFAEIAAWAEIFTEPERLVETVTKNWFLHQRGIKKDIEQEQVDWASGNYFAAGVDTADALVKLIGPVE
jgi:hypothetical protein